MATVLAQPDCGLEQLPLQRFLALIRDQSVALWVDGDRLRVSAPTGALTLELKRAISHRKAELIAFLSGGDPIQPRTDGYSGVHDVSFAQERLWFVSQLEGMASAMYNVPLAVRVRGKLDMAVLQASLDALLERHSALRTTFSVVDGLPKQVVAHQLRVQLHQVDLRGAPADKRDQLLHEALTREARRPFHLDRGPLIRARIFRVADDDSVLIATLHHIVCDGWSIGILARDLSALYGAFSRGEPSPLEPLRIQYVDYAAWQRRRLAGPELTRLLDYWRERLADAPLELDLPTDHPRPAVISGRGDCVLFDLPRALVDDLTTLSRAHGATLFMGLVAVFGVILSRYARQDDLLIGAPIAGRTRRELEELVGMFVNTLALRVDLTSAPSFIELLARIRETALEAYANQDLPFEKLVEALQPRRSGARHPIVQAMLVLHSEASRASDSEAEFQAEAADVGIELLDLQTGTSKVELSLSLSETASGMQGCLEFSTDLFERTTIERLACHFQTLLAAAIADPQRSVADLPMLPSDERERVLQDWNATSLPFAAMTLAELVERQADRVPEHTAVSCAGVSLSYRELDERANRLAHQLRTLGVGANSIAALSLERTPNMVVALLAVAKAGGAYLPLDPNYPLERRKFMLTDSQATVLLTDGAGANDLSANGLTVVNLNDRGMAACIAAQPNWRPAPSAKPDDVAYVMYTSGSTGLPKGVCVPHRAVVNLLAAAAMTPGISARDTVLALTTLSFDIAVYDLWAPLSVGASLVLAPTTALSDVSQLLALLAQSRATIMQATPVTWRLLVDAGWQGSRTFKVISTGEALPRDLSDQLAQRSDDVWNMYGPTETTVWSSAWQVSRGARAVPIGRPLANTQLYVLDAQGQPVPIGVPGELFIGGAGVSDGYLGRPDLTASRFVPDRFAGVDGARMYRTGDLARWLPDGTVEYLGRNDQQVKLRGLRIELEEIETHLRAQSAVRATAVMAREDTPGDQRLVAYVVTSGEPLDPRALRTELRTHLPEYMLPSTFVQLAELPLTPNGKVDRKALPRPEVGGPSGALASAAPPRDAIERQLISLWEELLQTTGIGIHDNFFDLGGHSLLAARLVFRIKSTFGRNLPVATLIQSATVAQLADILRAPEDAEVWDPLVTLQRGLPGRPPIFFVHGAFGDVLCYSDLARALGPQQPCYVLQAIGLDGERPPLDRVDQMAAEYIEEIREIQPSGPYCLAGFSIGGTIAFEMACQLRAAGEEVGLLGIFDHTLANGAFVRPISWPTYLGRLSRNVLVNVPHWLQMAREVPPSEVRDAVSERLRLGRRALSRLFARQAPSTAQLMREVEEQNGLSHLQDWPEYRRRVLEGQFRAMATYEFRTYPGRLTLFRAQRQPLVSAHDPYLGWGEAVLGGIDVVPVPGSHNYLLRRPDCVQVLANQLRASLDALPNSLYAISTATAAQP